MKKATPFILVGIALLALASCSSPYSATERVPVSPEAYEIRQESRYQFEKEETQLQWR